MRPLHLGQDVVLFCSDAAVDCRVIAAAGHFVLLRPASPERVEIASCVGTSSLTYLDGIIPVGWDGAVEAGSRPDELRFRASEDDRAADRRWTARVPVVAQVAVTAADREAVDGQVLDVSAGGLRFRHSGRFGPGELVHVRCELAGELVVDADAITRGAERGVTSVEFQEMHAATAQEVGVWTVDVLRAYLTRG